MAKTKRDGRLAEYLRRGFPAVREKKQGLATTRHADDDEIIEWVLTGKTEGYRHPVDKQGNACGWPRFSNVVKRYALVEKNKEFLKTFGTVYPGKKRMETTIYNAAATYYTSGWTAKKTIVASMREAGLDPAVIKDVEAYHYAGEIKMAKPCKRQSTAKNKANENISLHDSPSDRLVTLKEITRDEATALIGGKTEKPGGIDPARNLKDFGDRYYLANIPILSLGDPMGEATLEEWNSFGSKKRVEEYAGRKTKAPPIVVKMFKEDNGFLRLIDGGHRLGAAVKNGRKFINAIVIKSTAKNKTNETISLHAGNSGLDLNVENGKAFVFGIGTTKGNRMKGEGTKLMESLVDYLDKNHLECSLTASKVDADTDMKRLVKFYSRFGFVVIDDTDDENVLMVRFGTSK